MKKIAAILMAMILVMSVMVVIAGGAEGVNSDATIEGKLHEQISVQIVPEQLKTEKINDFDWVILPGCSHISKQGSHISKIIDSAKPKIISDSSTLHLMESTVLAQKKVKIKDVRIDHEFLEKAKLSPNETQRVIIIFHKKPPGYEKFIRSLGGNLTHDYTIIEGISIRIPGRFVERLKELENLVSIQEDREVHAFLTESIPLINADEVWAKGINGSGKTVCVVDTGIDYNHPALQGKVIAQKCYCQGNLGPSGCCPNGGEIEDNAMDDNGHGTHCAGIIASEDSTYRGVAPGANLMAVKVLDSSGSGSMSDVIAGIDWCSTQGADVISLSLGGTTKYADYCDGNADAQAVNNAVDNGSVVVIASGNDGWTDGISSPACASNATSVGDVYDADVGSITWGSPPNTCTDSTTYADKIVCHCNRNEILDLLAPGALITSTVLNSGFAAYGGTSMAAPHVSGAAAVLLEANPTLTPAEVESVLENTGINLTDTEGSGLIFPRIDVLAALNEVSGVEVKVDTYEDFDYTQTEKFFNINDTVYIQANVTDMTGNPVTDAQVYAELWVDSTLEDNITLTHYANCLYRGSFPSTAHSIGVYLINASASSSEGSASCSNEFHLYSGSGVSAYQLDWDDDKNKDYMLENKHLISVYDGKTDTEKSLLYLYQKDIDVNYTLGSISDSDSIGRGEITTSNMKDIKFYSFSLQEGENLVSADLEMKVNIIDPPPITILGPESFETSVPPSGWTEENYVTGSKDWERGHFADPNGPSDGSSSAVVEYDANYAQDAWLITPSLDLSTYENCELIFNIDYMSSWWDEHLYIKLSKDDGSTWPVFVYDYYQVDMSQTVDNSHSLSEGEGYSDVKIAFQLYTATPDAGDSIGLDYVRVDCTEVAGVETTLNLTTQMKSQDVDYLAYKLHNFDQNISEINDIFSPITGTLGSSVSDDHYHLEDGSDGLVTSLTANQWNNYTTSNYTIIYDNSTSADSTDDNVVAFVRFNETKGFQDIGLWYDSSYTTEGFRIRYNTTQIIPTDEIRYIIAFTEGDWQTIDQWMPNIAQRQFPTPNFMTPPAAGAPNVSVTVNTTSFGSVLAGNSTEIHVSLTLENTGDAPAEIEAVFKTNVSAVYGLMNGTSENIIPGNNFELGLDGKETALTNTTTTTLISILAAGANVTYDAILIVPAGQAADDYNGIVELSW